MADLATDHPHSGSERIVYECVMSYQAAIRYGDDDRFSHWETRQRTLHIIAASQALAEAAWTKEHGWAGSKSTLESCIPICTIDREVKLA